MLRCLNGRNDACIRSKEITTMPVTEVRGSHTSVTVSTNKTGGNSAQIKRVFLGSQPYYGLRTIMNMGKSTDYESILRMADMNTLEHRRIEQSLMIFFKCFKENGPGYVANLFKPRVTPYNLRSNGLNRTRVLL